MGKERRTEGGQGNEREEGLGKERRKERKTEGE